MEAAIVDPVSRRKFLKGVFAGLAMLTPARGLASKKSITLSVDEDGNATLQGAEVVVDENHHATLYEDR